MSGPAAATEATAHALARMGDAVTVVLVEGASDQIAVETLARSADVDLSAHGVAVVPTGALTGSVATPNGSAPAAKVDG